MGVSDLFQATRKKKEMAQMYESCQCVVVVVVVVVVAVHFVQLNLS